MRTTINLEVALLKQLKKLALERSESVSSLAEQLIRSGLSSLPAKSRTKKFRLITVKGELVNPSLDLSRSSEILSSDDELNFKR